MPFKRSMKGLPSEVLAAKGLLYHDWPALTKCQRECMTRLGMTIQLEQEAYMTQHPEVRAALEIYISKMTQLVKRKEFMKETVSHFTRSFADLDEEVREILSLPPDGPYTKEKLSTYTFNDIDLECDLKHIIEKHYPMDTWSLSPTVVDTIDTVSSSFLSINTTDTTLPTPEPIPTPEPTLSETMFALVSNTIDKAIFLHVDDRALRYDFAYVELKNAVEEAMEVPVQEIREEIANMFYNSFRFFEMNIAEKERIAAEIAWEKRMRKKMKRTLRRMENFKGYETPPTPKSQVSSHESYKKPPPRPCVCQPKCHYNRYPKDRFGIYLPKEQNFRRNNTTATPAISLESVADNQDNEKTDGKSSSKKAPISTKNGNTIKTRKV